jgi:hypothetical protein
VNHDELLLKTLAKYDEEEAAIKAEIKAKEESIIKESYER